MNNRNSTSKKNKESYSNNKTRKKEEELSVSAVKSIKKKMLKL